MSRGLAIAAGVGLAFVAASYATKRAADAAALADGSDGSTAIDYLNPWQAVESVYLQNRTEQDMSEANVRAFLDVLAWAEGTARAADPYRVCYSYKNVIDGRDGIAGTFDDWVDHPTITGEWAGEPLDHLGPRYAGLKSTAAGKYQIIVGTWREAKRALKLPDFSPDSQDKAAVYLIRRRGALDDVMRGDLQAAVDKCAAEWASLPGSTSGQPQRKFDQLAAVYERAGGNIA